MGKTCHNCGFEVDETHSGPCPNCKKEEGYHLSRSVVEKLKISDNVNLDLKNIGLDPNQILKISKMLEANNKVAEATKTVLNILGSDEMKKIHQQTKSIMNIVSAQKKTFKFRFSGCQTAGKGRKRAKRHQKKSRLTGRKCKVNSGRTVKIPTGDIGKIGKTAYTA